MFLTRFQEFFFKGNKRFLIQLFFLKIMIFFCFHLNESVIILKNGRRKRHHYATGLTCRAFFFFSKLGEGNGKGGGEEETEASLKGLSTCVQRRAVI